jgi:hypothetical protein
MPNVTVSDKWKGDDMKKAIGATALLVVCFTQTSFMQPLFGITVTRAYLPIY